MTTKQLIKKLIESDPDGNTEVVVDNEPIFCVSNVPAYYDGSMQILKTDLEEHICGYKITGIGRKVRIMTTDYKWVLFDYPEIDVDLSGLSDSNYCYYAEEVAKARREGFNSIKKEKK